MSSRIGKCVVVALCLYFLYFQGLTATGLLGPDEPRYASIGREMARSGDWITPRLWGEPWFEKPPLLYWMTAGAFRLGLGPDLAPRLPVAILSVAFLIFFWSQLRREFGDACAGYATAVLATSAAWIGYSDVGVTDLPMSAAFSAGMLMCLPWILRRDKRLLPVAGACFGLAVLGKGLVPLVLAAPLAWFAVRRLRDWILPVITGLVVAVPWYAVCTMRNGSAFLDDFFLKHHLARFSSESLQHVQPFWFYLPVLVGAVFPWTPALALIAKRTVQHHRARSFFLLWMAWGFLFFSASTNKLPGYLLPLLPAAAALMGFGLAESKRAPQWLAVCVALLFIIPVAANVLPQALESGLSRAVIDPRGLIYGLPLFAAAAVIWRLSPRRALFAAALVAVVSYATLKMAVAPAVDGRVSSRSLWREIEPEREQVCVGEINRAWRYGLNYYAVDPLPSCTDQPRPRQVMQGSDRRPHVE